MQADVYDGLTIMEGLGRAGLVAPFDIPNEKDYPAALRMIAEALARDFTGHFRERLLQQQGEILARLAQRNQQEQLRQANRVSTAPASPTPPPGPAASEPASPGSAPPWR